MKRLLLILGLSLGLATQANAFGKSPPFHPDPYKVMTKGKILSDGFNGVRSQLTVSYDGKMFICFATKENWTYFCREVQAKTDK